MFNKVLIVEDETIQRTVLEEFMKRNLTMIPVLARNGREALEILATQENDISLIIMDLNMPVMSGHEALPIMAEQYPQIPVIILTGSQNTQDAVEAMRNGAIDFIPKPFDKARMIITIENALKFNTLKQEITRIKQEEEGSFKFSNLIGYSSGLSQCVTMGRKVASSDIPALITGPTGSGKEVFSHAIHAESKRHNKPFIAVNCGAIPSQLVESTLFGHEKGAFTGAVEKVPGKFREADGGTIFLDEVGELPLDTQVKLLRVLQQKEVETVGAAQPIPVDVRVISATNRNLKEEVKKGHFREDLYFRLNVLEIELPALKQRKDDILPLARHFINRFCAREACAPISINNNAAKILENHDWPGNVRQLENAINRAIVLAEGKELDESLFQNLLTPKNDSEASSITPHQKQLDVATVKHPFTHANGALKTLKEIELEAMKNALSIYNENTTQAAKALGIAKSTFYRKIAELEE